MKIKTRGKEIGGKPLADLVRLLIGYGQIMERGEKGYDAGTSTGRRRAPASARSRVYPIAIRRRAESRDSFAGNSVALSPSAARFR